MTTVDIIFFLSLAFVLTMAIVAELVNHVVAKEEKERKTYTAIRAVENPDGFIEYELIEEEAH